MKLRDMLRDYCDINGLRIVRVGNLDLFFAVRKPDLSEVRYLEKRDVEQLKNSSYARKRIHELKWPDIDEFDKSLSISDKELLVRANQVQNEIDRKNRK